MPVRHKTDDARYFLGIDGGGTRTTAWLADARGRVLGRATGGASNPVKVGLKTAEREIVATAREARRAAGLGRIRIDSVCAGVAGAAGDEMRRPLAQALERGIPARLHLLTHDAAIALECALGSAPGVIVISGTGSIAFGRGAKGRVLRSGGWGSQFDDEGSGYDIGRKAIQAALRAEDGRGPRTRLGTDICQSLRIGATAEIGGLDPDRVAALFPVVHRAALEGDSVARRLCIEAGADLAALAAALLSRTGSRKEARRVICAGGVFKASEIVRRSFARRLRRSSPGVTIALLHRQPVEGAVALAMRAAHCAQDEVR